MKRLPCPSCRGTRFQVADPPVPGAPFAMDLCPACKGLGVVYVEVRSPVEVITRPVRLGVARVLAVVLPFIG
jgi:hypothetical protein